MSTVLNTSECQAQLNTSGQLIASVGIGIQASVDMWEAILIIVVTGVFASLLAAAFTYLRKVVYNDKDSLDTSFDAGGKVNAGLTATTIVSQWIWAATLLQSSTVASKYGVSGAFWYAAGATIQILLFAVVSVQLKTRAPGAKTFLQVIKARFGKTTHKVFCVFALATNIIVTAMLMLGGAAVITSLVKVISLEYATTLVAAIIGAYTFIGGLGATVYVSYFNTSIMYFILVIFIAKVYMEPDNPSNPLGSADRMYDILSCAKGPVGNLDNSYLTLVSNPGLMFGFINIVGNFGAVFVDQSYWQSSVAAKPQQGALGFLLGGITWFAMPFSFSTCMGLAYVALSAAHGEPLLTDEEVNAGLVAPAVASRLLGRSGDVMMLVMVLMAVTSTGSAEVMAVTSILIYDIYGIYLKPYRKTTDTNSCILCGKGRGRMANPRDKCTCISMSHCTSCHQDDKNRDLDQRSLRREYKCQTHGHYREYTDYLNRLKNWCLVWTTMAILPLTVVLYMLGVDLNWTYLFVGILVGSAVIPITLCMFWSRLTGVAMVTGSVSGTIVALVTWLCVASTYEGGLFNFLQNTGKELSMLCGNLVALLFSGIVTVLMTFVTNRHYDKSQDAEVWENTRDIDNPLAPWTEVYAKELHLRGAQQLDNRPSMQEVNDTFRAARLLANIGSVVLTVILVLVWPAFMVLARVMSREEFIQWVNVSKAWAILALLFVVVVPLLNEAWDVASAFKARAKVSDDVDDAPAPRQTRVERQRSPRAKTVHTSPPLTARLSSSHKHFTDVSVPESSVVGVRDGDFRVSHVVNDATMEPDLPLETQGIVGNGESGNAVDLRLPVF